MTPKTLEEQAAEKGLEVGDFRSGGTPEPVLDISTLAPERPAIRIRTKEDPEGKLYDLAIMDDFGIEEQQVLTREGAEFDRLWNTDDLSTTDLQRLKQLLDRMFERILKVPKTVRAKVNDGQRSQIVLAFTLAPLAAAARREREAEEAAEREETPTTAN